MEGKPDPNFKDDSPKVADPSIPNRMVSTKNANKPFLSYVLPPFIHPPFTVSLSILDTGREEFF